MGVNKRHAKVVGALFIWNRISQTFVEASIDIVSFPTQTILAHT